MKALLSAVAVAIAAIALLVVFAFPVSSISPEARTAVRTAPVVPSAPAAIAHVAGVATKRVPQQPVGDHASLRHRLDQLLTRGTARDRYQAFNLLAQCAHAVDFDRYLKSLPPSVETAHLRERYGDGSVRIAASCGDLSPRQVEQRIELVAAAADQGVPGAASAWIEEGPYGDRTALTQRPDDPLVMAWVEQAIERVLAATRRSDTEAISQFGSLCLNWEMDDVARVRLLVDAALQRRREDQLKTMLN
ncbi:MAG TPA: hypothetical protein VFO28_16300 [Burkholderiaceae bacterium]|nr:hypothetical protein [Burkholderiaceae bacterium]